MVNLEPPFRPATIDDATVLAQVRASKSPKQGAELDQDLDLTTARFSPAQSRWYDARVIENQKISGVQQLR